MKKDQTFLLFSLLFSEYFHLYLRKAHSRKVPLSTCSITNVMGRSTVSDDTSKHNSSFKAGVNPEILKNRDCHKFRTITVMNIKVYIFGMEISQRIYFDINFYLK